MIEFSHWYFTSNAYLVIAVALPLVVCVMAQKPRALLPLWIIFGYILVSLILLNLHLWNL
jgi:hypothetical protein